MGFAEKLFGTYSERQLKKIRPIVAKIEALSDKYKEKEIIPVLAKVDTSLPIEGQVKDALKLLLR